MISEEKKRQTIKKLKGFQVDRRVPGTKTTYIFNTSVKLE